jgi:uncharacterized surface protein with fasciclin (FAS1) repeats
MQLPKLTTRLTTRLAAGVTAATVAASGAALVASPAEAAQGKRSLATVLAADGNRFDRNWQDFDILEKAVVRVLTQKPDSDVAVLTRGGQRLTAFLPTDRAFRRLVNDLAGSKLKSERNVWRAVRATADVPTLEAVLLYHVVPGATVTRKQAERADGARLTTAAGSDIRVNVVRHDIRLKDLDPDDLNPQVIRGLADINKGNRQIGHGINRVLRPLNL